MQQEFERILRDAHKSVTSARYAVFRTLLNARQPLKNGEIAKRTQDIDRASVYRTLDLFSQLGITTTISRGWTAYTELAEPFTPHHHHLTCLNCKKTVSVEEHSELEKLISTIAQSHSFTESAHQLEIQGYCSNCRMLADATLDVA